MCAQDPNQPVHPCSLIRLFDIQMKKLGPLAIQEAPSYDSDHIAQMCRLI